MKRPCNVCGEPYEAKRPNSKYCSERCRKRHQRGARKAKPATVTELPRSLGDIESSTLETLAGAERQDTPLGRTALGLARRLDDADRETGQGLSSLAGRFQIVLSDAMAGAHMEADPIDELRAARDRKRRRASAG